MKKTLRNLTLTGILAGSLFDSGCSYNEEIVSQNNPPYVESKDYPQLTSQNDREFVKVYTSAPEPELKKPEGKSIKLIDHAVLKRLFFPWLDNAHSQSTDMDKFPVIFHEIYEAPWHFENEQKQYIGQNGAISYLIDSDGRLLTKGSHFIKRKGQDIFVRTGAIETLNVPPRNYCDGFLPDVKNWLENGFEERNGGLYVRDLNGFLKGN